MVDNGGAAGGRRLSAAPARLPSILLCTVLLVDAQEALCKPLRETQRRCHLLGAGGIWAARQCTLHRYWNRFEKPAAQQRHQPQLGHAKSLLAELLGGCR